MSSGRLRLDWAPHDAVVFACKHWHYSRSVPAGKSVKIGVWEDDVFKGVILFSRGANKSIASPYGLDQTKVCELTRVALKGHTAPVTQMIAIAIKMLKKQSPGLELIVSYADRDQGHEGKIYKAGNWIYEGLMNDGAMVAFRVHGKRMHPKSVHSKWGTGSQRLSWLRENIDPNAELIKGTGKHKYLYPLSDRMRKQLSTRGGGVGSDTSGYQSGKAGATPSSPHTDHDSQSTNKAQNNAKEKGG